MYESSWKRGVACAADELVQATPENFAGLDFVWVRGADVRTAAKSVRGDYHRRFSGTLSTS